MLRNTPEVFANGSLVSRTMRDPVVLCYLLSDLARRQANGETTMSPADIVRTALVDGIPVEDSLNDISKTSLKSDVRIAIAGRIAPILRGLLIACSGHKLGRVGVAQFSAVDMATGIISFVFTTVLEFSSSDPTNPSTPADVLRRVARFAFGAEEIPGELPTSRVSAATVSCM